MVPLIHIELLFLTPKGVPGIYLFLRFQNGCFEEVLNFVLIGILCGLAIYNFTIIYVPFPLVLYKKLLGEDSDQPVGLDDLEGLSPSLAKGDFIISTKVKKLIKEIVLIKG